MTLRNTIAGLATGCLALFAFAGTAQADPYGPHGYNSGHKPYYNQGYGHHKGYGHKGHYYGQNQYQNYGRGQGGVILFEHGDFRGKHVGVADDIPRLNDVRFNDNISSIVVNYGTWEVCSDAYFRGRCYTINGSIPKTSHLGLNDNISSIRRVDGYHRTGGRW